MDKYPRLTFRLSQQLATQLSYLSRSRHRTRGQIVREAIALYYRAFNPVVSQEDSATTNT